MAAKHTLREYLITSVCILHALVFVYAAASKLLDFEMFQVQLRQSPLLSSFAGWVSWAVPVSEFAIAGSLLFPRTRFWALFASFGLMVMFSAYIYIMLHYSSFVPCSCGGILEDLSWNEHLVFNLALVVLAAAAVFLELPHANGQSAMSASRRLSGLAIISTLGIASVAGLFLLSEEMIHHNNNFTRRFAQHPIVAAHDIDLGYNSYYFAGSGNGSIYLANSTAPSLMTVIDTALSDRIEHTMKLDNDRFPFRALQVKVAPPHFYVLDGTVPLIYQGDLSDWTAHLRGSKGAYFDLAVLTDSDHLVFRIIDPKTSTNVLGSFAISNTSAATYKSGLLEKQVDGIFDTDGMLLYSPGIGKVVYLYYYRNQFIVADQDLNLAYRGNTIDTTSRADIKVAVLKKHAQSKMDAPPLLVNKSCAVSNNLLFVNSDLPGRHESRQMWDKAAVVDVYDLNDNSYLFSCYVENVKGKKMKSFIVTDQHLFAIIGDHLVSYNLAASIRNKFKPTTPEKTN
ncbi:MauE/DoxX family redox-associated membrane protein [Flavobacterium macacae]|uniref:Methylamine utilisation protein MauE domain-containing protein n=1 Tax=Flavobacterium macacae TaxID=2488993 RepID=A0A3P3W6H9_9FLAO|nr:MauE/DoxX family redox-associated membrane protein [Flavobacterium macacae]RRJ90762.1 hypothetical protein EG849_09805 [Flavobacterium macacae]